MNKRSCLRLLICAVCFAAGWLAAEPFKTKLIPVPPFKGVEGRFVPITEVTGGGVSLAEIDARTMESKRHRGLFLCGEMLDAFGPIGGYNFLWAWATGRAAGLGAASSSGGE